MSGCSTQPCTPNDNDNDSDNEEYGGVSNEEVDHNDDSVEDYGDHDGGNNDGDDEEEEEEEKEEGGDCNSILPGRPEGVEREPL